MESKYLPHRVYLNIKQSETFRMTPHSRRSLYVDFCSLPPLAKFVSAFFFSLLLGCFFFFLLLIQSLKTIPTQQSGERSISGGRVSGSIRVCHCECWESEGREKRAISKECSSDLGSRDELGCNLLYSCVAFC